MASRMARSVRSMISSAERLEALEAELVHELEQALAAHGAAGDLGVEVAHHQIGHARVRADERVEGAVEPPRLVELHDRDEEPFLVDLARLRGQDVSADVGRVAGRREEGDAVARRGTPACRS